MAGTHDLLAEALELHDVRGQHRAAVAADEREVLADHPERVSVEDDEHALFLRDGQRELGEALHVVFAP